MRDPLAHRSTKTIEKRSTGIMDLKEIVSNWKTSLHLLYLVSLRIHYRLYTFIFVGSTGLIDPVEPGTVTLYLKYHVCQRILWGHRSRVRSERQIPGEYSTPAWNFRRKCRSESDSRGKFRGTDAESVESKKHLTRRSREDGGAHRYARVSILLNINGYFWRLFPP